MAAVDLNTLLTQSFVDNTTGAIKAHHMRDFAESAAPLHYAERWTNFEDSAPYVQPAGAKGGWEFLTRNALAVGAGADNGYSLSEGFSRVSDGSSLVLANAALPVDCMVLATVSFGVSLDGGASQPATCFVALGDALELYGGARSQSANPPADGIAAGVTTMLKFKKDTNLRVAYRFNSPDSTFTAKWRSIYVSLLAFPLWHTTEESNMQVPWGNI